eukprot:767532-Hanusia_phi.AAC.4
MRTKIAELEEELAMRSMKSSMTDLLGLLGSFQFLCGDLSAARLSYERAVSLERKAGGTGAGGSKYAAALARVNRQMEAEESFAAIRPSLNASCQEPLNLKDIERRDGAQLSYREFLSEYACKGVPVRRGPDVVPSSPAVIVTRLFSRDSLKLECSLTEHGDSTSCGRTWAASSSFLGTEW